MWWCDPLFAACAESSSSVVFGCVRFGACADWFVFVFGAKAFFRCCSIDWCVRTIESVENTFDAVESYCARVNRKKMSENKFLFARLGNQNYQTWKLRMEMLLKREDLWSVVADVKPEPVTAVWTRSDQKCHATVVLYLEDSQLCLIKDAESAKDVWNKLKTYHEKATMTSRVSLLKKICSLNLCESGDVEKHLIELEELFDRLACAGQALEDPLKIAMMLRSLPDSYSGLVTALESRPEADLTMPFVKQRLLDEYQRRAERSVEPGEKVMKMQSKGQKKRLCYHCQKPGHFRKDCRLLLQQQQQQSKKSEEVPKSGKQEKKKKSDAKQVAEVILSCVSRLRMSGIGAAGISTAAALATCRMIARFS